MVTAFWIAFTVYQTTITSTISEKVSLEINPIKPEFDLKTLERLKKREQAIPQYQTQPVAPTQPPSVPTPSPRINENNTQNATGDASLKL